MRRKSEDGDCNLREERKASTRGDESGRAARYGLEGMLVTVQVGRGQV